MKNTIKFLLCICFFYSCCHSCMASGDTVYLRGSTTLVPMARSVAEAYMAEHPDSRILIGTGGSERGYKSVLNGTADVAMVSSEFCDVLPYECTNDISLEKTSLGYVIIKVLVNKSNSVDNLTIQQLRDIFTGRITNWEEVGGDRESINVYLSPPSSGISFAWKKLIFKSEDSYTPKSKVESEGDVERLLSFVASDKNAISFAVYDVSNYGKIKAITVNGLSATDLALAKNQYPLRTELMLATRKNTIQNSSDETSRFIKYFVDYVSRQSLIDLAKINHVGKRNE